MSKKSLVIILALIVAVGAGFFVRRVQDTRAEAAKIESEILTQLTAEEIELIIKNGDSNLGKIAENAKSRRLFLRGLREYLALAAEARREGLTEDANFKVNLEYKQNILLADLYQAESGTENSEFYAVSKDEIEAVWKNPANEKQFEIDMDTLRAIQTAAAKERGEQISIQKFQGGTLQKARENWARTKFFSDKAKADAEFLQKPEVQLRLKILEAGILSSDYLRKHWAKNIRAAEQEITDYLAAHPEYDVKKKREKAEMILRKAQAGENFSRLAVEYSEDRATKNNGGLYENIGRDFLWAEVENAALALENNQIADRIVETDTGFHVLKLENKQIESEKNGSKTVKYSIRHILLQKNFEEPNINNPNIPPPFIKAEEIAKTEIEKQKRSEFVAAVIERSKIVLPEDFTVGLPENVPVNP